MVSQTLLASLAPPPHRREIHCELKATSPASLLNAQSLTRSKRRLRPLRGCNADIGAAPRPFTTREKVTLLVLATDATWSDTGATATSVVCRAQELVALWVLANNRS